MLTQIGICNQNDETSVEELSHEKCLNESTVLSWKRVIADPLDKHGHSLS